jgi:glycosyltransferase involved in cell wall biosynthesis
MNDNLLQPVGDIASLQNADRRRRIALVFHGFAGGGLERSILQLAEGLMERGFAVDIVVGGTTGVLLREVPPNARIVELQKAHPWRAVAYGLLSEASAWRMLALLELRPLKRLFRRLPSLTDYFRNVRPDAIFAADPNYNSLSVYARHLARLRATVVASEHNQPSAQAAFKGPWREHRLHPVLRRAYLKADAIVAVSDGVAADLASFANIPRQRITTIYNPVVGPDLATKACEPLDHPWLAAGEPPVILGVGRLDPQKDFPTLIRAFARVRAQRPARLIVLGAEGHERHSKYIAELKALPARLGIADDVDLPGFRHNPFAFMSRAAVFVLSSIYEGLGNVLIEALACGTPVVSTDCPSGPAEILEGGRFGALVPVGDDAAMAAAIAATLDRPPAAATLRERARMFSVERAVDRYLDLMFEER